jgi:CIC family chloride channel protein
VASTGFIRGLSFAEDAFERIENPYLRNFVGMSALGILIYVLLIMAGHYFVEGVGYATIQAILTGGLNMPALLLLLFVAELCATSASLRRRLLGRNCSWAQQSAAPSVLWSPPSS